MARPIVIDANATLGLFLHLPYTQKIELKMQEWQVESARLCVPTLWEYECLTGLRRAVFLKHLSPQAASLMVDKLVGMAFQIIAPTSALHHSAFIWAERLNQSKTYDAHYLALAEDLSAEFWTADQRLANSLQGLGVDWVHTL